MNGREANLLGDLFRSEIHVGLKRGGGGGGRREEHVKN